MRLIIAARDRNEEVIAEPFEIEGSPERFAVHRALPNDWIFGDWVATHVETGYAVGRADSIDGAINEARAKWQGATPELIAARIAEGRAERERRLAEGMIPS